MRVLWAMDDADRFVEIVEYADQGAYERDQIRTEEDPRMRGYLERWRALLEGPPGVEVFRVESPGA